MTFLSVLLALILEQKRALPFNNPVTGLLRYHALRIRQALDVGKSKYEAMAWLSVALPWTLAAALIYIALYRLHFLFSFAWNVVILYFTLGFRQFSHHFTDIQRALNQDDIGRARETLHKWTGIKISDMPASEIVRQTLAHAVIAVHRHVFGVFFWFLMPLGPAGAVLYRIAETLARTWSKPSGALLTPHDTNAPPSASFSRFAQRAFYWIDWLPARLTAFGFAVVGNFEDAVHTWRTLRQPWIAANDTVLATVGGGALGAPLTAPHTAEYPDLAAHCRHYLVAPARSESACPFLHCFPRGKKSEAAVGDCVSIERRARDQGVIIKILPRRAWLCRSDRFKSRIFASNFDQLLFVLAAVPRVSEMLLGRALVAAHAHRVRALIVLNKTDLEAAARVARARLDLYRSLGYTALEISAKTQPEAARSQLEIRLKHQITLLLGPSGTGKSTLVNLLAPGAQAKTQEISTALRTGKHTTAFTRLYPLKNGGALIDSPGFQNFGLHHVSEKVFAQAFTEFQPFVSQCRFSDCRHLHEPECAVRTAVVARKIDTQRYALYAQLLREAQLTRF